MDTQESSNKIIDQIKENALACFSISIVISYFSCYGYYLNFNLDISTFLSIEDLTVIYSKWIWLSVFSTFLCFSFLYLLFKNVDIGSKETYWDETIGKTKYKKRIYYLVPTLILIILLAVLFKEVRQVLSQVAGLSVALFFLCALIIMTYSSLTSIKNFSNSSIGDLLNLIIALYMFIFFLPMIVGLIIADNTKHDKIQVVFDDGKILNSKDSTNCIYVGKTTNYFFICDTAKEISTAYSMGKVKSMTIIQSK